jgi:hypothetical protein
MTTKNIAWFHADHSLLQSHKDLVEKAALGEHTDKVVTKLEAGAFFIKVLELPPTLGDVVCGLYGPTEGDEAVPESDVKYECRNGRPCASRLVDRPMRPARFVVFMGLNLPTELKLFTAYGSLKGSVAEREPGDTTIDSWELVQASRLFWETHALSNRS